MRAAVPTRVDGGFRVVHVEGRDHPYRAAAIELLARFFEEEGFATPPARLAENLDRMLIDPSCWVALMIDSSQTVGVITVATTLYVEWGRLAEIGDLYVIPGHRGRGLARRLIAAAVDWAGGRGCSGTYVTLTPDGEARHQLSRFYAKLDFRPTGRTTMMLVTQS
jgi:GNAT superfamily N-acetyltransferase